MLTFKEEMQNYLNSLSETEIVDGNIKKMLKTKSTELANSLSTENMKLSSCEIYLLEINDAGTEGIQMITYTNTLSFLTFYKNIRKKYISDIF